MSRMRKIKEFILAGLVLIVLTILCFAPTELFILLRYFLKPVGFWQNIVLFGVGVWVLGIFQFFGLIVWLFVIYGTFFSEG